MHPNDQADPAAIRTQNQSCPAGGTNQVDQGQRGVVVAPPSRNTNHSNPENITVVHCGFDTLAVAVKANIPPDLVEFLEREKAEAEAEHQPLLVEFNGIKMHLQSHGGRGYQFLLSDGQDGARWAFKLPNTKDAWGIRVIFGSDFLSTFGLGAAKARLEFVLDRFGVRFGADDISISRADFCVDLLAPEFKLNPDQFLMHSRANRREHCIETEKVNHGKSNRTTSVTIGSPRNRQVIVYDKRTEVIQRNKKHWWKIWNHNLRKLGLREIDPKNRDTSQIWRIEFRAGKDLLKDTWKIRTWTDFFDRFGDLCRQSGETIRYVEPDQNDGNRSRWPNHPIWEIACATINDDLIEMRSDCDPIALKAVRRAGHISVLTKGILGSLVSLAALKDVEFDSFGQFLDETANEFTHEAKLRPEKISKQLETAKNRYVFI